MGLSKVICVGAGPSGLLLALLLAKNGINVELFDADKAVSEQPRAAHYAPPAVAELRRAGVYDDVASAGYMPRDFTWRKPDGTPVASMYFDVITPEEDRMVVLPLNHLCKILYSHLEAQPSAKVQWNHKVVDIGQDGDKAWVMVETPEGHQKHEADYIIGCDGANSQVRRSLFGDLNYPGETLNAQIIATNVNATPSLIGTLDNRSNAALANRHLFRYTTTSPNTGIRTQTISSTQRIGIW